MLFVVKAVPPGHAFQCDILKHLRERIADLTLCEVPIKSLSDILTEREIFPKSLEEWAQPFLFALFGII